MSFSDKPIGIFDSGVGGLTVLKELSNLLPHESYVYVADSKNAPYGRKTNEEVIDRSLNISRFLIQKGVKMIVVACNTATAAAIDVLRRELDVPIVGIEPAIKPASILSRSGRIGVLATEGTSKGKLFLEKNELYGEYVDIHFQDAYRLVEFAEENVFEGDDLDIFLNSILEPMLTTGVDQLVLGCTHYPLFWDNLNNKVSGSMNIINPADAIARRAKDLLMRNRLLNCNENQVRYSYFTNGKANILLNILERLEIKTCNEDIYDLRV